ncbi:MAG: BamA/TamA family outer membrane protein [Schleiferiaceae bacterium]|nr:BamA/TamA family outer membrane protein [Schleiferiaceae bacterium]
MRPKQGIWLAILAASLMSCQPQRYVTEPWIRKVQIEVDGNVTLDEHYSEVLMARSNTSVFGTFPYMWFYQKANPQSYSKWNNWLRRIGEKPSLWDSTLSAQDVIQLRLRLKQDGYFYSSVTVHPPGSDLKKNKHLLRYEILKGPATQIQGTDIQSMGPQVDPFLSELKASSTLLPGDVLQMEALDAERRRIAKTLQEKGFFTLGPEAIHFDLDTIEHPGFAEVQIRIDNWIHSSEYGTVEEAHRIWYVRQTTGSWPANLALKPSGIQRLPWIPAGRAFQASAVTQSTARLRNIPAIQSGRWQFAMVQDSLDATLSLVPSPRVGLTWKGESTALSGIYGLQSSIDVFDHNPWGGLEHVHLTLSGGLGAQWADSSALFNTYFLDVESGIQWPGLWGWGEAPVQTGSTRLSLSIGRQYRREFDRLAIRAALEYQWTDKHGGQWELSPTDLTYIDLRQIDSSFYQALSIKSGFQDVLLLGPRLRVLRPLVQKGRWERRSEWTLESSGIVTDLINRSFFPNGPEIRSLAEVPYAHYLRAKWDVRWLRRGSRHRDWALRFVAGELHTLQNTPGIPPFERAFFSGGSNDLRGWINFRLGPGALPLGVFDSLAYLGSGTRKLLFQTEYRFPLTGALSGAIFTDAGNTWLHRRNLDQAASPLLQNPQIQDVVSFSASNLLRHSAWDAGLGIRYDLDFFVIRVDWGLQVYDPRRLSSKPWFQANEWLKRGSLNFGLGMPF